MHIDFSLPRLEVKTNKGHRGFKVDCQSSLSFKEAASRRDFTINAIGFNLHTQSILDPYGGLKDLKIGILKHVSNAFGEDPLRALRAIQFVARFEFTIDKSTQKICGEQLLQELPQERIFMEFKKWLLKSSRPSLGMIWLKRMNLLKFFPEFFDLEKQSTKKGLNVWLQTQKVLDQAAKVRRQIQDEHSQLCLMFSALCYALKNPLSFLTRITRNQKLTETVLSFIQNYTQPLELFSRKHQVTNGEIRRLSLKVDVPTLLYFSEAYFYTHVLENEIQEFLAGAWLTKRYQELNLHRELPKPMLKGALLKKYGISSGPLMGKLIREAFELQLDGKISDKKTLTAWLKRYKLGKTEECL